MNGRKNEQKNIYSTKWEDEVKSKEGGVLLWEEQKKKLVALNGGGDLRRKKKPYGNILFEKFQHGVCGPDGGLTGKVSSVWKSFSCRIKSSSNIRRVSHNGSSSSS